MPVGRERGLCLVGGGVLRMVSLCSWRVAPKLLVIYSIICFIWQSLRIRIVHQQCHQVWHSPFEVISGCGSAVNGLLGNSTIGCSLCGIFHCWPCVHTHVCYLYVSEQAFGTTTYPIERSSHSLSGHILIIYVCEVSTCLCKRIGEED